MPSSSPLSLRLKRFVGRQLEKADLALAMMNRNWREGKKFRSELAFWEELLPLTLDWYQGKSPWYGIPPPTTAQRQELGDLPIANAVYTLHHLCPSYLVKLQLARDHFAGQRILEIGSGPLVPIMQFTDCERHALDPLMDMYAAIGWPIYAYKVVCTRSSAESMPYPDGYFDAVLSVNALDHVDHFDKVAAEIQRVTKPGGGLYFEIEYHKPRVCEPQDLNDEKVRAAFADSILDKAADRGKKDVFELLGQDSHHVSNEERLVLWRGQKRPAAKA